MEIWLVVCRFGCASCVSEGQARDRDHERRGSPLNVVGAYEVIGEEGEDDGGRYEREPDGRGSTCVFVGVAHAGDSVFTTPISYSSRTWPRV